MDRDKLVTDNLPFVTHIAKQYVGKGLPLEDLISEGTMGMIRAAEKYDEKRNFSFVGYAVLFIRQAIQQAIADNSRAVRVPSTKVGQINRINRLRAEFEQKNERYPNINEVAESANTTEHNVKETLKASARNVSVDAPFSDSNPTTLLDMLAGDELSNTDRRTILDSLRESLETAVAQLSERERKVVSAFYGIGEPQMTFAEIGARYGFSRERARQIRKKGVRHLRSVTKNKVLRSYLGN